MSEAEGNLAGRAKRVGKLRLYLLRSGSKSIVVTALHEYAAKAVALGRTNDVDWAMVTTTATELKLSDSMGIVVEPW